MKAIFKGLKELIAGMGITGKHLGRHAITIQYPEERWEMPERSRGIVVLLSDKETGELNCTGCMLCMRACPTAAITIDAPRGEDKKRVLKKFDIDFTICCFCGLCEEACNFSAIKMAPKYEFSVENKNELIWDMNKLQEVGRDVPYVDTRKKKPVKKPDASVNPAPAAAEANPGTVATEPKPETPAPEEKKADTDNNEGGA
ncbi:MAG: NADH-quinone oxidoreductase subunit I [candidate division Zixibacteria bacterium]|nr:NADH-quinone oxidoreductase subunit I [candidate division Zixibacteria bacterium]